MLKALAVVVAFALAVLAGGRQLGLFDSAQTAAHPLDAKPAADDAADALADRGRWVREVTPICRHSDDWFDRQPSPQKARGYDRYLAKIAVRIRSVNAKIMALRPPIGEKRKIRALGALFKTDERLIAEISAAAQRRDWMTYETIRDKLLGVFERESRLFERLGASACTIGSSASR